MKQNFFNNIDSSAQLNSHSIKTENGIALKLPEKVRIRTRYIEDDIFVNTSVDVWKHQRYCRMDWRKCILQEPIFGAFRQYIWHRLSEAAPRTAQIDFNCIIALQDSLNINSFPWSESACKSILVKSEKKRNEFLSFRLFYRWAAKNGFTGFSLEISSLIDDIACPKSEGYGC